MCAVPPQAALACSNQASRVIQNSPVSLAATRNVFLLTFINIFGSLRANPTGVTQSSFRLSPTPGWIWSSRSTAGAPDPPQELQIYPWSSRSTPGAPESSSGLLKVKPAGLLNPLAPFPSRTPGNTHFVRIKHPGCCYHLQSR